MRRQPADDQRRRDPAEQPGPGLCWTDRGGKLSPADRSSRNIGEHVGRDHHRKNPDDDFQTPGQRAKPDERHRREAGISQPEGGRPRKRQEQERSEEHTSELQSLMRISYAVFCLKKKTTHKKRRTTSS